MCGEGGVFVLRVRVFVIGSPDDTGDTGVS